MSDEIKEEVIEEEVKECDGVCETCEDPCGLDDFCYEPIHKKGSCANVFSIIAKAFAGLYFVIGTYSYIMSIVDYVGMYGEKPGVVDVAYGFISSVILYTICFWAIGEIINLVNRIKEAVMF
ncbi:MAG: hypothetical protein MJ246_00960 [Clostridia bacterium]|nr:hypothetical protein [Clostridia bacterium]